MLKRSFSFKKSSARKFTVPNPLKLNSQDVNRELGEELETVDVKVGKHRVKFDPATGQWQTRKVQTSPNDPSKDQIQHIQKDIELLSHENNMLKLKVEIMLNLVAESIADLSVK